METPFELATRLLKLHEGLRLKPYKDSKGNLSIGYGHNLDDKSITSRAAETILYDDIRDAYIDAQCFVGVDTWRNLSNPRQAVVIDMAFNMGLGRLSKFNKFKEALIAKKWLIAASEMMDSRWAGQVGKRAKRLSEIMYSGQMPVL